jgi:hypothetical protein
MMWLFIAMSARAEPLEQLSRAEVAVEGFDDWEVVPLGTDGLVLVGKESSGKSFEIRRLDANFQQQWTVAYNPDSREQLVDAASSATSLWLAFAHPGRDLFTLLGFDRKTGEQVVVDCAADDKIFGLEGLSVDDAGHAWALAITDVRRRGDLYAIDLAAKTASAMGVAAHVGVKKLSFDAITLGPGPADRTVTTLEIDHGHRDLTLVPFGASGLGAPIRLATAPGDDVNLLSGTAMPTGPGAGLVLGTYASGLTDQGAQGMYVMGYAAGAPTWAKYHTFTSFEHFFDFLPENRRARIEAAAARKEANGKDLELNYLLLPHAPLQLPDRTVLVAEAYFPVTTTYTTTSTSTVNGVTTTTTTTHTVFVGWEFSHAVIAAFGPTGERLWDTSAPIGNVLLPRVRPVVSVIPAGDHMTIAYASKGKIYSLVADANGVTGEKGEQSPETDESADEVKTSWDSHSAWWHDDVFLIWGFERVKGEKGRRTVFSFSSLRAPAAG